MNPDSPTTVRGCYAATAVLAIASVLLALAHRTDHSHPPVNVYFDPAKNHPWGDCSEQDRTTNQALVLCATEAEIERTLGPLGPVAQVRLLSRALALTAHDPQRDAPLLNCALPYLRSLDLDLEPLLPTAAEAPSLLREPTLRRSKRAERCCLALILEAHELREPRSCVSSESSPP